MRTPCPALLLSISALSVFVSSAVANDEPATDATKSAVRQLETAQQKLAETKKQAALKNKAVQDVTAQLKQLEQQLKLVQQQLQADQKALSAVLELQAAAEKNVQHATALVQKHQAADALLATAATAEAAVAKAQAEQRSLEENAADLARMVSEQEQATIDSAAAIKAAAE